MSEGSYQEAIGIVDGMPGPDAIEEAERAVIAAAERCASLNFDNWTGSPWFRAYYELQDAVEKLRAARARAEEGR